MTGPALDVPLRPVRWARRRWRRSLQLRVVATTTLLGMVVVVVVGALLLDRIQSGLVQERLTVARGEAARGRADAQARFDTAPDGSNLNLLVNDLLPRLASPEPDRSRDVVLLHGLDNDRPPVVPDLSSRDVSRTIVPLDLRRRVVASGDQEAEFVQVRRTGSAVTVPGIVVGSQVAVPVGGDYELYFVFTLQREQATINLVQRTLLLGGVVLIALVGAIAFVVTRQVVAPVRQAAQVAGKLSSGRLSERLVPRGEDDLATLARSFNTMADHLQSQIGQLEQLSRMQQRFVSDVSHELRTPLTTIRMAGDVLHEARGDFEPAAARSAELLRSQLDRFEALLSELLEISRIDAGGELLEREPVDLRDVAVRVVEAATPLTGPSGSRIELRTTGASCVADVDVRRVERILRNLVVNAIEHGNGLPVEVRTGSDQHAVAVTVRDHGVGLRPGESSLVFNRFWRGDPSRARTMGGTGLGLAISSEDARLHGGWLQAWGEPGRGACFRLTLPRTAGVDLTSSPLPLAPVVPDLEVGGPYLRLNQAAPHRDVAPGPRVDVGPTATGARPAPAGSSASTTSTASTASTAAASTAAVPPAAPVEPPAAAPAGPPTTQSTRQPAPQPATQSGTQPSAAASPATAQVRGSEPARAAGPAEPRRDRGGADA